MSPQAKPRGPVARTNKVLRCRWCPFVTPLWNRQGRATGWARLKHHVDDDHPDALADIQAQAVAQAPIVGEEADLEGQDLEQDLDADIEDPQDDKDS